MKKQDINQVCLYSKKRDLKRRKRIKVLKNPNRKRWKCNKKVTPRLPSTLTLTNDISRRSLLATISYIKNCNTNLKPCFLDFALTQKLMPTGTIHLKHQIDKAHSLRIKGRSSSDPVVRSMFTKLGIHKRVGINDDYRPHLLVDRWHILEGQGYDFGDDHLNLNKELEVLITDKEKLLTVNNAISEAVSNVVEHAYDKDDDYKKWILFLSLNDNDLYIVISDLGKSIPSTTKLKHGEQLLDWATNFFGGANLTDSDKIEFATVLGRSQTEEAHRGKGFGKILKVEKSFKKASVLILSRNGSLLSESTEEGDTKQKRLFKEPIDGTIVCWKIPLLSTNFLEQAA